MKLTTIYLCSKCDAQSPKWNGQCLECGAWGTLELTSSHHQKNISPSSVPAVHSLAFDTISAGKNDRTTSGMNEVDRVFGGGIVPGSVTLLGGEPGIGKSTLALMLASQCTLQNKKVLYVSGEESASQVKLRADRLCLAQKNLFFLSETNVDAVLATFTQEKPAFTIIDSIQTLSSDEVPSEAGAVNQIRGATAKIVNFAKTTNIPVLIIGHVTKDGNVAGPKTLEHLVDTVLSFEGERTHPLRILRAIKNRFGSTDETGIFEMEESGLKEIKNPSAYLLDARQSGIPGSAISCIIEGTRPILVEIQALVQKTSFGYPTRKTSGFDNGRLEMLLAVLGRRGGIDLGQYDVFINVVGGLKIKEPATDLAVILALASAARHVPLPDHFATWGEVGLGGEVRPALSTDRRLNEAATLGITQVTTPIPRTAIKKKPATLKIMDIKSIREALLVFEKVKA